MFSWSTQAVEAWSALATAIAAGVGVPFLLWDRFRAKPHQVGGYLAISGEGLLSVYVYSELGERLILTSLDGRPFFALAPKDTRTIGEKKAGAPHAELWMSRLPMRKVAEAGHTGNAPLTQVQIRISRNDSLWPRLHRAVAQPTIVARGVLPYRARGGRFRFELSLPEHNLREAVLRSTKKRKPASQETNQPSAR